MVTFGARCHDKLDCDRNSTIAIHLRIQTLAEQSQRLLRRSRRVFTCSWVTKLYSKNSNFWFSKNMDSIFQNLFMQLISWNFNSKSESRKVIQKNFWISYQAVADCKYYPFCYRRWKIPSNSRPKSRAAGKRRTTKIHSISSVLRESRLQGWQRRCEHSASRWNRLRNTAPRTCYKKSQSLILKNFCTDSLEDGRF